MSDVYDYWIAGRCTLCGKIVQECRCGGQREYTARQGRASAASIKQWVASLGLNPETVRRIIIDMEDADTPRIYVEFFGMGRSNR